MSLELERRNLSKSLIYAHLFLIALLLSFNLALALPQGPVINFISNSTVSNSPATRTDAQGTIVVMNFNASQQSYKWKAYVGNVTGKLSLDDASGFTIYDWTMATISGEVYASRANNINWSAVTCASQSIIDSEEAALNIPSGALDGINATFNYTAHKSFYVGNTLINQNTCRSTATYINDAPQTVDVNAKFQEILLSDGTNLIYVTIIENNQAGYNNQPYDFQMIVADDESAATPSTYYFWVELG